MAETEKHKFEKLDFSITEERIEEFADKYIELRSHVKNIEDIENDPRFKNLGFSTQNIKDYFAKNTQPIRVSDRSVKDIYRSDLGEMLLTMYFDAGYAGLGESFVIPLKNIWDREHNDLPGRGIDVTGYKELSGKIEIFIGEAKVSSEQKSPPQVSEDIYREQLKYTSSDKTYLKRRISNYAKKLDAKDAANFTLVLMALEIEGMENIYELVFGCCLVRDTECYGDKDFGKMKSQKDSFSPNRIHFIVPVFDKPISETVDLFHKKVEEKING